MSDILIITASNGHNLKLANQVQSHLDQKDVSHDLLDLVALNWPLFTPGQDKTAEFSAQLNQAIEKLQAAKAMIWISPEYNGALPPTLANFIAWVSTDSDNFRISFNSKPAAIMSFSGSGTNVLQIMRLQLAYLGMNVVGRQLLANYSKPAKDDSIEAICNEIIK